MEIPLSYQTPRFRLVLDIECDDTDAELTRELTIIRSKVRALIQVRALQLGMTEQEARGCLCKGNVDTRKPAHSLTVRQPEDNMLAISGTGD